MVGWKCCRIEARVGKLGGVDTRYLIVRRRALDGALGLCAGGEVSRPGIVVLLAVPAMAGGKGLADDAMRAIRGNGVATSANAYVYAVPGPGHEAASNPRVG